MESFNAKTATIAPHPPLMFSSSSAYSPSSSASNSSPLSISQLSSPSSSNSHHLPSLNYSLNTNTNVNQTSHSPSTHLPSLNYSLNPNTNVNQTSHSPSTHLPSLNYSLNTNTNVNQTPHSPSPSPSPSPPPPPPPVVLSPCAACKILRRRCVEKCVLAPYFPPTEPLKFTIAHRVFGASNIIKLLQELPESHRADAVSSMVYEANARIRDPVYGCTGAICHLQKQISELQGQLAQAQAEVVNMKCQQGNLFALICMDMTQQSKDPMLQNQSYIDTTCFLDENNLGTGWDPLWT